MTYKIADGVHSREVDDDLVILDSAGDRYFSLNPSGIVVWRRVTEGGTADEAATDLVGEFAIPFEQAIRDVKELLVGLTSAGLLLPDRGL